MDNKILQAIFVGLVLLFAVIRVKLRNVKVARVIVPICALLLVVSSVLGYLYKTEWSKPQKTMASQQQPLPLCGQFRLKLLFQ